MVLKTTAAGLLFLVAVGTTSGCDLAPLRQADLFEASDAADARPDVDAVSSPDAAAGAAPDGGADTSRPGGSGADAGRSDTRSAPDGPTPACQPGRRDGLLSGYVRDACPGGPHLTARVGIGGQHTCSFDGKGSVFIADLPVGCVLLLTVARPGYVDHQEEIVVPADGRSVMVSLRRASGSCDGPPPDAPPLCACDAGVCR